MQKYMGAPNMNAQEGKNRCPVETVKRLNYCVRNRMHDSVRGQHLYEASYPIDIITILHEPVLKKDIHEFTGIFFL